MVRLMRAIETFSKEKVYVAVWSDIWASILLHFALYFDQLNHLFFSEVVAKS